MEDMDEMVEGDYLENTPDPPSKRKKSTRTKTEPTYPFFKYVELFEPEIHRYTVAYLEAGFRGILKTKKEWATAIESAMEDNK